MIQGRERIAVVGTGISGLVCAHLLQRRHDVEVFEAADRIGGHTNTVRVMLRGRPYDVDTGFIVHNDRTYPGFQQLLRTLGVETQPSVMGFSVSCARTGLEWSGTNLGGVFAQRRNLLRPAFHRMLRDILRFHRAARALLTEPERALTLGEFLDGGRYGAALADHYVLPMGAAIWSAGVERMREFPAHAFARFFENHGLLSLDDRPTWRVIRGGSYRYVEALTAPFRERIHLRTPVREIQRRRDHVSVLTRERGVERFDHVVLATHSDQALNLLADPTPAEVEVLGAIPYQDNEVVLHTDASLLPRTRRAWASWNYRIPPKPGGSVAVTYLMNVLQSLDAPEPLCVSLNQGEAIDPSRILFRTVYDHPVFTVATLAAQRRRAEVSGVGRTHYCGAYWGNGFHEDGVRSALAVCAAFGETL